MKTFQVSLDILSSAPLVELERMFGIAANDGSHSAGDKSATGSPWETSRLRVDSKVAEDAPVAAHVQSLLARVPNRGLPEGMQLVLTIAVFTDSPMSSVVLDVGEVKRVADRGWMVEVITYFTDFTTQRRPTIQRLLRLVRAVRIWRAQASSPAG